MSFVGIFVSRRQRLRALQLELHPDKQPEDRRSVVQPLFLLVQQEWESQPEEVETTTTLDKDEGRPQNWEWEWAKRRATAFSDQDKAKEQNSKTKQPKKQGQGATKPKPKPKPTSKATVPETRHFAFNTDIGDSDSDGHDQLEMGSHWTPYSEDDEDTGIVPLLAMGSFESAMHAFTSIQLARRSRGLDAEKPGHPWKAKMDRFEAEAWRLYAKQQVQKGFQKFAIAEHLYKAISLHPDRGELYFDRAISRVRFACLGTETPSVTDLSKLPDKEFQKVLEDCETALCWDSSLLDAFDLALRLCCVSFELSKISDLATRGRRSALAHHNGDRARDFAAWRRSAKVVQRGLDEAQKALSVTCPKEFLENRKTGLDR